MRERPVESELLDLERMYWTAIMEKDAVVARQLSHDRCVVTAADGGATPVDPASFREIMDALPWILDAFELEDMHVRLVGDDVAIVAYTVKETLIVEGAPMMREAADSSTWIRTDGRWLCAHHVMA